MFSPQSQFDKQCFSFLQSVKIASIRRSEAELITLNEKDSIENAFKKLAIHAISSAPVFNENHQKMLGSLSTLDLAFWAVRTYSIVKGDKAVYDWNTVDELFKTPIKEVIPLGIESYWPVHEDDTLANLINNYFKWRIHRAPVIINNKITGYVTQSDVVAFLAQNLESLGPVVNKNLKELGLDVGPVFSVLKGKPLIEAFSGITESKFTGLAIIDEQDKLINNISASDLKGVTKDTFWKLDLPIEQVLGDKKKVPPLTCRPTDVLGSVLQRLADCRVHRIYVVDTEHRPQNVITLTTIMKVFSSQGSECFV